MNPLFEVRYVQDKALLQAFYRHNILRSPLAFILYLICFTDLLRTIDLFLTQAPFNLRYLLRAAFMAGLLLFQYHRSVNLTYKRSLEQNNGEIPEPHLAVTESGIVPLAPQPGQELSFDTIAKVRQTKTLIFLYTNAKLVWIFPKDSFLLGDPDEFLTFLKERGLKVRI